MSQPQKKQKTSDEKNDIVKEQKKDEYTVVKLPNSRSKEIRLFSYNEESDKTCPILHCLDSVAGLLYNPGEQYVVVVKQKRFGAIRDSNPEGIITELVAGTMDKDKTPLQTFIEEAEEEVGIKIVEKQVQHVNGGEPLILSSARLDEHCHLFFATFTESDIDKKSDFHRGVPPFEDITRVRIPVSQFISQTHQDLRLFAMAQFLKCYFMMMRDKMEKNNKKFFCKK